MPDITAPIDRHQRDGLYELVRNHLGAISNLWIHSRRLTVSSRFKQTGTARSLFRQISGIALTRFMISRSRPPGD